jgi:hypothetical protein
MSAVAIAATAIVIAHFFHDVFEVILFFLKKPLASGLKGVTHDSYGRFVYC